MMTRRDIDNRLQIEFNSVDALVPENHLIRKIDAALDFNFIYDEVAELYSAFGAPSIDPVVLIKIVMIQYLFGIPSMRQTIREIEVNIAYRWFIGYSFMKEDLKILIYLTIYSLKYWNRLISMGSLIYLRYT